MKNMPNNIFSSDIMMNLTEFFTSPAFFTVISVVKILFILISVFFIGFIIFVLIKSTYMKRLIFVDTREFVSFRSFGIRKLSRQWLKIREGLEKGMESQYKLSVIEADSILDDTLKKMGFLGETLGERLEKLTSATLPNIEDVLVAHTVRNNIVHDPDYKLGLEEAKKTIDIYEKSLVDLQAL